MERYLLAKQDHYGGKTPEETLAMFVEALKKKDAKLAARYYLPWEWEKREEEMIEWINTSAYNRFLETYDKQIIFKRQFVDDYALYIKSDKNEKYLYRIWFVLNKATGIWKIKEF